MPIRALVKLPEVAALLETGDRLDPLLAREKVGRKDAGQVQPRENLDRGRRTLFAQAVEDLADREAERAFISESVQARRRRWDFTQSKH